MLYSCLARAEGRGKWGPVAAESTPLIFKNALIMTSQAKCEAIAQTFYYKLQAPAALQPETEFTNIDHYPLDSFKERVEGNHERVTAVEVLKALEGLSTGKAPGPDLIPVKVYKRMGMLTPYLVDLVNLVYRTGSVPKILRGVFLVPITKPGNKKTCQVIS